MDLFSNTFYLFYLMDTELQQYATINCKKVAKAKTVSLKLLDEKDEKTNFDKQPINLKSTALQQLKPPHHNFGFSYLNNSKGPIEKQKSFDEIMNETRKVLQMKKKIEEDQKKRSSEKNSRKQKRKMKREQKQQKKSRKNKKNQQKEEPVEQDIVLTALDIERFETEETSIKNIIQKIKFLQDLSEKCDIFRPILQSIDNDNDEHISQTESVSMGKIFREPNFLGKLQTLELEIEFMKENLDRDQESKQIMTPFEIKRFAEWQVSSRISNSVGKGIGQCELIQKYTDLQNQQIHAQELENELKHLDDTFFSLL